MTTRRRKVRDRKAANWWRRTLRVLRLTRYVGTSVSISTDVAKRVEQEWLLGPEASRHRPPPPGLRSIQGNAISTDVAKQWQQERLFGPAPSRLSVTSTAWEAESA